MVSIFSFNNTEKGHTGWVLPLSTYDALNKDIFGEYTYNKNVLNINISNLHILIRMIVLNLFLIITFFTFFFEVPCD